MTSGTPFPKRLSRVDELSLPDHYYLSEEDFCLYLGEYTPRKGYRYSDTNQIISNFKKKVNLKNTYQWRYKGEAIREVASAFREAIGDDSLRAMTFVPVPPSKSKDDSMYDDRLTQMLQAMNPALPVDIRELVVQDTSTLEAHLSDERPRPDELVELYRLEEALTEPIPSLIAIVDDLLTTGCHFKAMKAVLARRFPGVQVVGLFVARRVPNTDEPDE